MKFSVIVPVYNAENYLHKLVESVLQQTYKDYELILVDDGSTDGSYALMKQYAKRYDQIKAYTKENTGPGMTRKFGFEKATGDLLFFVDSDDWITNSTVLEEIHNTFIKHSTVDVLFFDREDIIGNTKEVIRGFEEIEKGFHNINEIREVIRPGLGAKILKRNILTPDMFIESKVFEDLFTTYLYLEKCNTFYYSSKSYYTIYHDVNSNSLSSNETAESFNKSLEMILMIYEKINNRALKYSLELRMATLFTSYWKSIIKKEKGYDSETIRKNIRRIVSILKDNNIMLKPNEKKLVKMFLYKILLFWSVRFV
ncbi:glycosyltransferase family 2 protein [Faecalibacterium prausnitzii]|uniref:glycosyltransferase family 2 protein n=1 Tax=Faecalibacterium prausnitzii TaxID=853 RepID=UPI002909E04D|nr:glycosyltransferase family 2 protein [Faecalibacterium prausnitzii]MDU8724170.1 glycosyltransferase family 2 protein [Faecalibacterium prausnitzii]